MAGLIFCDCINPAFFRKKSFIAAIAAWTAFVIIGSSFLGGPCFYYFGYLHQIWFLPVLMTIGFLYSGTCFAAATFMDPGYVVPRASLAESPNWLPDPPSLSVLINGKWVERKFCPTCKFYRPLRTSHCSTCNACITQLDHHCPWLNNCVGIRNYPPFFFFLVSLTAVLIGCVTICSIIISWEIDNKSQPVLWMSFVLLFLTAIVLLFIASLLSYHVKLIFTEESTKERMKGYKNPYGSRSLRNFCTILCSPVYPSMLRHKKGCFVTRKDLEEMRKRTPV